MSPEDPFSWIKPLNYLKPFMLATESIVVLLVSTGLGHHDSQLASEKVSLMVKYIFVQDVLYQFALTMPKYSALLFYVRVFGIREKSGLFRINLLAAAALVSVWLLSALLFFIFECNPVRKGWLPLTPGHCFDLFRFLWIAASSTLIDVYIMLLPLPILWSLHTGPTRKIKLTGFFFCAYW